MGECFLLNIANTIRTPQLGKLLKKPTLFEVLGDNLGMELRILIVLGSLGRFPISEARRLSV